jgi:serine/threonine-protein kinase RsbW
MTQTACGITLMDADFPATLEEIDRVCREARMILKQENLQGADFRLQLLLREALNNAVFHGNKGDGRKRVICQINRINQGFLEIIVEDQGEGFNWRGRLDRELNELAGSGRGLPIMKHYGSALRFNEKGNRLKIQMALDSRAPSFEAGLTKNEKE